MNNYPIARELVLVGGGHSHVILLRMLGMQPVEGLRVTLISPDSSTPYSGMLPGLVAGHYDKDDVFIDLVPLCRFAGADFIRGTVEGVDTASQRLLVQGRPALRYDVLSLDIGCTPSLAELDPDDGVIPVKPISTFLDRYEVFCARLAGDQIRSIGFTGAGAGGVELCLAVHHAFETNPSLQFHLFTDGKTVLKDFDAGVRVRFERLLAARRIEVHREFRATAFESGRLKSIDGREQAVDELFWVTQASAQQWPQDAGLGCDERGFIEVGDTLQSVTHPNIFAVGDCATMINFPRPKAGVYAVRQGKPLFNNIRHFVLGRAPRRFKPQSNFLSLVSTGSRSAIASRNGLNVEGDWVWIWKNWIDRRFMQRFTELPQMEYKPVNALQAQFDVQTHCGGCGSKVSSDILNEVLSELLGDAAPVDDAALVEVPAGKQLIQSVDHFRSMLNDPYLQARIAVCHAMSDIYACGGDAHSAMAMLTLPFGKPAATKSLLTLLLKGTIDQLQEEGVALIGGHTSEGLELSIGFAVNGLIAKEKRWQKEGLNVGDYLILTKPLGTGTLFAADMQFKAKGQWIEEATDMMLLSNREAAEVLKEFEVSACTDVTGFGLAGHCLEMLGGKLGALIFGSSLPVLTGAATCLGELGIRSSLHESNVAAAGLADDYPDILFDPQTSGGLLFGVAEDDARACLDRLQAEGFEQAAVIGVVTEQPGLSVTYEF